MKQKNHKKLQITRSSKKQLAKKIAVNATGLAVMVGVVWVKTHWSGQGNCVELASLTSDTRGIRDSKNPDGGILMVNPTSLNKFFTDIKTGKYNN